MTVTPIHNPLPGEAALEVVPKLAREVGDADWRRRINLFSGRAVSDVALRLEQQERSGRLATLAQSVSPGVVAGLEASTAIGTQADGTLFHALMISPGLGLAASGEDVMITRPLSINLRDVPVYTSGAPEAADTLGALLDQEALPLAGVLLLEPIVADLVGAGDSSDPCERDPQNDPFDDWQSVDGCRVVYMAWPQAWQPLPVVSDQWRNRIAYTIFEEEMKYGPDEVLPWEAVGVPIALAAFGAASGDNAIAPWAPLFLDRFSVVRAGGKPRRRSRLVPASGNAFLFQARVQQFAEQLADLGLQSTLLSEAAAQFRYLPPFGLLPRQAADPRDGKSRFFPSSYYVDAIPVPSEQLDAVLRATASLARFDTGTPDRVRLLVPVPQTLYEPRLLQIEIIDQSFQTALTEALTRRGEWLQRREDVRGKSKTIVKAITGAPQEYPPLDQDPDALEHEEQVGTATLNPPEEAYQTEGTVATRYDKFLRELMGGAPWGVRETVTPLAVLAPAIHLPDALPPAFKGRIRYDAVKTQLVVAGVLGDDDVELLQGIAGANAAWKTAIAELHTQSVAAFNTTPEIRELNERGIRGSFRFSTT